MRPRFFILSAVLSLIREAETPPRRTPPMSCVRSRAAGPAAGNHTIYYKRNPLVLSRGPGAKIPPYSEKSRSGRPVRKRDPRNGIIGGLVVGEAAVEARLISASMLIVVAVSGIAGLMIPRLRAAVFYVRLGLVLLAAWMGIVGCLVGITLLLIRMMGISSFGVPYLLPLETPTVQGLKDTVVRLPWSMMRTRPFFTRDRVRQKRGNDR